MATAHGRRSRGRQLAAGKACCRAPSQQCTCRHTPAALRQGLCPPAACPALPRSLVQVVPVGEHLASVAEPGSRPQRRSRRPHHGIHPNILPLVLWDIVDRVQAGRQGRRREGEQACGASGDGEGGGLASWHVHARQVLASTNRGTRLAGHLLWTTGRAHPLHPHSCTCSRCHRRSPRPWPPPLLPWSTRSSAAAATHARPHSCWAGERPASEPRQRCPASPSPSSSKRTAREKNKPVLSASINGRS